MLREGDLISQKILHTTVLPCKNKNPKSVFRRVICILQRSLTGFQFAFHILMKLFLLLRAVRTQRTRWSYEVAHILVVTGRKGAPPCTICLPSSQFFRESPQNTAYRQRKYQIPFLELFPWNYRLLFSKSILRILVRSSDRLSPNNSECAWINRLFGFTAYRGVVVKRGSL